jgi:hypothetical protein
MFLVVRVHRFLLMALALTLAAVAAAAYCQVWPWDQRGESVPVQPGEAGARPSRTGEPTAGFQPPTAETVFAVAVGMLLSHLLGRALRRWTARRAGQP